MIVSTQHGTHCSTEVHLLQVDFCTQNCVSAGRDVVPVRPEAASMVPTGGFLEFKLNQNHCNTREKSN